jgi:hypothetical protein
MACIELYGTLLKIDNLEEQESVNDLLENRKLSQLVRTRCADCSIGLKLSMHSIGDFISNLFDALIFM